MKQCSKCKELKDESFFYDEKKCRDGKRPECKACVKVRQQLVYNQRSDDFKSGQHRKNVCPKCERPKTRYALLCHRCARRTDPSNPQWYKNKKGYIVAAVGRSEVRQHRFVMEKILGRKLFTKESVHHKNGIRDDNRPENLELWSSSHPCGQRIEDK